MSRDFRPQEQVGCSVYFLTDGMNRSYIGYSTDVCKRFYTHRNKLVASAKYTKGFQECHLIAYITGFPDKRTAMSFEWMAKHRTLKCHRTSLRFISMNAQEPKSKPFVRINDLPSKRLWKFFAALKHPKYADILPVLRVYSYDPLILTSVANYYHID